MTNDAGFDLATVDRLLTTTRAVRKRLDFDREVPLSVIMECLDLAVQAPTGNNLQTWRWLVITSPEVKSALADLYRLGPPKPPDGAPVAELKSRLDPEAQERMSASTSHLYEHLHRIPVMVVPCVEGVGGAAGWQPSIYPAVWSFILALRSRGLGTVITTSHLYHRQEAKELLGVPDGYEQACLLPVAYTIGTDFRPAADRKPARDVTFIDRWGEPSA
ncbi:MAG: nitroreductase family protein [Acidimicrobiia bacterium]